MWLSAPTGADVTIVASRITARLERMIFFPLLTPRVSSKVRSREFTLASNFFLARLARALAGVGLESRIHLTVHHDYILCLKELCYGTFCLFTELALEWISVPEIA
jgi:hypothetical protein